MTEEIPCGSKYGANEADEIPCISLLGVKVSNVDMTDTLDIIRGFIKSGKPHIIVTADSSGIVRAQQDEEFRSLVNNADLVTPDSSGIIKAAAMLGTPLKAKVSGVEIAREMCGMSAKEGFSIYFLGAEPGVAEQAVENLSRDYPGLKVAGVHHGYFGPDKDPEVVELVKASGAQALLVAMGIPRQEKFIRNNMDKLGICVAMGVGGSFDVFSGRVRRAPVWFQKHGLEWLYRLAQNPKKISKVFSLPKFLALVMKEKVFHRTQQA